MYRILCLWVDPWMRFGLAMEENGEPFIFYIGLTLPATHCPYCGDQNLWPHEATHGAWECRDCQRVFSLKSLGLLRPEGVVRP